MKPSTNCFSFIQREEGEVLHPYLDSGGTATIGVGSTMYRDGRKVQITDPPITHLQAIELLSWEVNTKCSSVSAFTSNVVLTQNQYDALVSFAFNEGVGALQNSTLLKKVRANPQDPSIREEFNRWVYITKNGKKEICDTLVQRRKREADLYFS
jgi:lysozyme